MEGCHIFTILTTLVVVFIDLASSDFEYMLQVPEPVTLPSGFETKLLCEMNIEPDKFQWKFYPSPDPFDPNSYIDLGNGSFHLISEEKFRSQRKKSSLSLQVDSRTAGDYQCLAYYGAYGVASVPGRVTVATLGNFPRQQNVDETVLEGNTVSWRCLPPISNPEAYIDYFKNSEISPSDYSSNHGQSLILPRVTVSDSGLYSCSANNIVRNVNSSAFLNLKVVRYGAPERSPYFIAEQKRMYNAVKGDTVFLECVAVGNPVPRVTWFKQNGVIPSFRAEVLPGGLKITDVNSTDDGVYVCAFNNSRGSVSHQITLVYNEAPSIDCATNSTDIKQGENLDLDCIVQGTPEPHIYWFLNGYSVINDSSIEAIGNKIYIRPTEKRHAGNLQIFARNNVGTVYASISIRVIPLISTDTVITPPHNNHHRHRGKTGSTRKPQKHNKLPKMIPPSKPTILRINDESVMVRWNVPHNTGLPIQFFKVQYRELGPAGQHDSHNRSKGSRWKTTNADIAPNIKVYEVNNLKPDHIYKFRIAAVYSNNDNKLSLNSDKFHLKRLDFDDKNPLPVPLITKTEPVNTTSVKIHWKFTKSENVSVDGFVISYISASTAGDYLKATVDGENTREYTITHLQPDTIYDIKLQSFNSKLASEFSSIMKARTEAAQLVPPMTTLSPSLPTSNSEKPGYSLYVIVAGGVIGCALLICAVALLFVCRKWQKKKSDDRDKAGVEDHHIHEGNEYVVAPKSIPRANGCAPNRITITANPLADADNKNQNMIEMSCLSSQNNNCAATVRQEPSSSAQESPSDSKDKIKTKNKDKNKRNKLSTENVSSGENYV